MAFVLALARVGGVSLIASAAGWGICRALLPRGPAYRLERIGWSYGTGCALLAGFVPLAFLAHARPGWIAFGILGASSTAILHFFPSPPDGGRGQGEGGIRRPVSSLLGLLIALGLAVYALRAMTEPMWANDFLAIWGFKGKTIYTTASLPSRLYRSEDLGYSHPEYPLGLPFLYAGVAFLTGGWDDHAMALLFPMFQVATVCVLGGWLRRRGASGTVALLAAAILAWFEPLYSGFLTGMAEVPLSFGLVLFGTALADALDADAPAGSFRRLAVASAWIAATKNEGLFFAAAGCAIALVSGGARRWKAALAALPTALLVHLLHLAWRGRLPLRDFDVTTFSAARLGESFAAAMRVPALSGWIGLALVAALILLGDARGDRGRLLVLAGCGLAAYLVVPAVAVRGPEWLVSTTLLRTAAGLAPLAAAGIAVRFAPRDST